MLTLYIRIFVGDKDTTDSGAASLSAQQLTTNIDPILQMLLPKTSTEPDASNEERSMEEHEVSLKSEPAVTMITIPALKEDQEAPNTGNNPSTSQISLTPYIVPLSTTALPTIQLSGGGANITIPAIQLLQSLLTASSSLPPAKTTKSPPKVPPNRGGPLKAQSPTRIVEMNAEMEIKEEDVTLPSSSSDPKTPVANALGGDLPTNSTTGEEGEEDTSNSQQALNASNEILQQLLGLTPVSAGGDGLKSSWNINVSPSSLAAAVTGSASPVALGSTPKRKRQVFSGVQTTELEKHFETSSYIDSKERERLAEKIGLHPDQVKVWFQNRRTKRSRQSWRQKDTSGSTPTMEEQ